MTKSTTQITRNQSKRPPPDGIALNRLLVYAQGMKQTKSVLAAALALFLFTACATTQEVTFSNSINTASANTAYVVTHGGRSADMDVHIQNDLRARGLKVVTGPDVVKTSDGDILVKYSDRWRWDLAMYLEDVHIMIYDGKSGDLLATGLWQNSAFHKFPDAGEVIKGVMDEIFTKLKTGPKVSP
jgi:hypothetical protein